METKASEPRLRDELFAVDEREDGQQSDADTVFWNIAATLVAWRRFIALTAILASLCAVAVVLLLPNEYEATATVLAPSESASPLTAMLGRNLGSAARLLGGGSSADYTRYLSILSSRNVMEALVDSFDLVHVYELEDATYPREQTIRQLSKRSDFQVDSRFEFISISVLDKSRERAAAMANLFVQELNRRNQVLLSQNAGLYRQFVEERYHQVETALDSLLEASKSFQQAYGVFDLPSQTQAFFEQLGNLRAQEVQLRIQYEALRTQLGSENPQVLSLEEALAAAARQYQNALSGQEAALPIPRNAMPEVARQYAFLERERLIQVSILEVVAPMYEAARMEEERQTVAVQVLDEAVPPYRKSKPRRTLIVLMTAFSAFTVATLFALVFSWWHRNYRRLGLELRQHIAQLSNTRPT